MIIVVMGVLGSGKTTVGKVLASALEIPFYDADDFHKQLNIVKMEQGIPLQDIDRKVPAQKLDGGAMEHAASVHVATWAHPDAHPWSMAC